MFGQTSNSNTNPFGSTTAGFANFGFGKMTTPAFGVSSSPFAVQSTSFAFGTSTTPAFGFGQPFGAPRSPFGVQTATQTIGHTAAAVARHQGNAAAAYRSTPVKELEGNREVTKKLQSITSMPEYASVNFEELCFLDYMLRNKGGNNTTMKPNPFANSTTQPFSFPKMLPSPFTQTPSPSTVSSTPTIGLFKTTPTPTHTPTLFPNPFNICNVNPPFSNPWSSTKVTSPSPTTTSNVNPPFSNPWTSTQVTTPSPPSIFTFTPPTPSIPPPRNSTSTPPQSLFPIPSSNIFTPTQPQPSSTTMPQPNYFAQQQPQQQKQQQQQQQQPRQQVLLVPATNPFGTTRATPQVANGGTVQYGISSIPVADGPARTSVRVSLSLLDARNQIRSSFKSRINDLYNKKKNASSDHQRVPFFM